MNIDRRHSNLQPAIRLTFWICLMVFILSVHSSRQIFAQVDSKPKPPNVILILLDDMGYSDLGCYGGEIETPNMDRLGESGIRFTQFYNSARCCPSRASLMTGLYPHQTGIGSFTGSDRSKTRGRGYTGRLNRECLTIAEALKPAGYQTYCVGKWHLGNEDRNLPTNRGFDQFYGYTRGHSQHQWDPTRYRRLPQSSEEDRLDDGENFYATDQFNRYALKFLKQAQGNRKPFFLYLAHSSPHFPIQAPRKSVEKYYERYLSGWDKLRSRRFEKQKALGLCEEGWRQTQRSIVPVDKVAGAYSGNANPAWKEFNQRQQQDLARRMAIFAAMIDHVDRGIGEIVKLLADSGQLDNTLILITSDNGACYEWSPIGFDGPSRRQVHKVHTGDDLLNMGQKGTYHAVGSAWSCLSNTPLRMYKHFTHEGGICSPLIFHWPEKMDSLNKKGTFFRKPAHVIDIMPTILSAAGARYPKNHEGRRLIPLEGLNLMTLLNSESPMNRDIGFEHQGAKAFRSGNYKIVWSKREPNEIEWELYDLSKDRCETKNLAFSKPEVVEALRQKYDAWAARVFVTQPKNKK